MWQILKPVVGPLIDKLVDRIPDPNARAEAREQFETQLLTAVTEASTLQAKINQVEAAHSSVFVVSWRPFIGWVCGLSLLWAFLLQPIMVWGSKWPVSMWIFRLLRPAPCISWYWPCWAWAGCAPLKK
ncbi:3TM-type holin [Pseudobowmanella zhangzhouensis]|uniref:3TM-type holin n=1 Tax=Pseudobowmanella zhangzhouensis TaxID=1537679 RepID=UPI00361CE61B